MSSIHAVPALLDASRKASLSIIIPVLDDAPALQRLLAQAQAWRARGAELIVVDGGSRDGAEAVAAGQVNLFLTSAPGRARQMNAGAARAQGQNLWFLHADSRSPEQADLAVRSALRQPGVQWGRFDVRIDGRSAWLPVVATLMNLRSRWSGIATGDQGLFMTRQAFEQVGGFPPIPLMEDVAITRALKRLGRPACLRPPLHTSGRRWDQHGAWRTITLMWSLRLRYWLGASPQALHARYHGSRPALGPTTSDRTETKPSDSDVTIEPTTYLHTTQPDHRGGLGEGAEPRSDAPCAHPTLPTRCAVGIFARAPVPGQTKTRLIPAIGPQGAATVHAALTRRAVQAARDAGLGPVVLWTAGPVDHPAFDTLPDDVLRMAQPEGDLGERMQYALAHMRRMAPAAVVIGSDCPVMDAALLRTAAGALAGADLVFTPAEDGGYVLVGARIDTDAPFTGMVWSTADVMAQTRQRLQAAGLQWAETAPSWDIDEPQDLARAQRLGLLPAA